MSRNPAVWLDIDVLRVGRHRSLATSTSPAWAQTLRPLASVLSSGCQDPYGHPPREVAEGLLPFAQSVPAHASGTGARARQPVRATSCATRPRLRKAVYATASSRTMVVKSTGAGFSTTFGN